MLIYSNTVLTEEGKSFGYTFYNDVERKVVISVSMAFGATLIIYDENDLIVQIRGNNKRVVRLPEGHIKLVVFSGVVATSAVTLRSLSWFDYLYNYWFRYGA